LKFLISASVGMHYQVDDYEIGRAELSAVVILGAYRGVEVFVAEWIGEVRRGMAGTSLSRRV